MIAALLTTAGVLHIGAFAPVRTLARIAYGHGRPWHGRVETCGSILETDEGFRLTFDNRPSVQVSFAEVAKRVVLSSEDENEGTGLHFYVGQAP